MPARDLWRAGGSADGLIQVACKARQKGWWQRYGDSVEPHLATCLGMEGAASQICQHAVARVPILLQTELASPLSRAAPRAG